MANKYLTILSDKVQINKNKLSVDISDVGLDENTNYEMIIPQNGIIDINSQQSVNTPSLLVNTGEYDYYENKPKYPESSRIDLNEVKYKKNLNLTTYEIDFTKYSTLSTLLEYINALPCTIVTGNRLTTNNTRYANSLGWVLHNGCLNSNVFTNDERETNIYTQGLAKFTASNLYSVEYTTFIGTGSKAFFGLYGIKNDYIGNDTFQKLINRDNIKYLFHYHYTDDYYYKDNEIIPICKYTSNDGIEHDVDITTWKGKYITYKLYWSNIGLKNLHLVDFVSRRDVNLNETYPYNGANYHIKLILTYLNT